MEELKRLRIAKQLTRKALAEDLGMDPETIARYERGSASPTGKTLMRLSEILKTTPNDLLGWKEGKE